MSKGGNLNKKIKAVDLFCGAGGSSSGIVLACKNLGFSLDLTAINHWNTAIRTHQSNHPDARYLCESLLNALKSLNYNTDWRVLNSADYGDTTCRERFFLIARRGNKKIRWPVHTHSKNTDQLFPGTEKWRPAKDIIDWSLSGKNISDRKNPLKEKTLAKIDAGLKKFGNTQPRHPYLCEPFIIKYYSGSNGAKSINDPLCTITTRDRFALIQASGTDIRYRMLQPHELASAMSFADSYVFHGTRADKIRQIGNAVPVRIAESLCRTVLA